MAEPVAAKSTRMSYPIKLKLDAIKFAENNGGNRRAADHYGVDESMVRDWRKNKVKLTDLGNTKGEKTKTASRKRLPGYFYLY